MAIIFAAWVMNALWIAVERAHAARTFNAQKIADDLGELTPEQIVKVIRETVPRQALAGDDCESEQQLVDYWESVVDAATTSLMSAYEDLEACLNGDAPDVPNVPPTFDGR